jgi:DNA-directed RNA polymerase subunit RPC12/RpoP
MEPINCKGCGKLTQSGMITSTGFYCKYCAVKILRGEPNVEK